MARPKTDSAVLTLRVPAKVHRYLTREARRRRQTRSDIARAILQERVDDSSKPDLLLEARRQSLLVSKRRSERETLAFLDAVVDRRGWK
ncbi:MAG TPA: antitoxin MazE-like protein [Vicinamibacterales bacterium]|nr:antitoxin MazE-like protein [Vicinamibacterales bacterium]